MGHREAPRHHRNPRTVEDRDIATFAQDADRRREHQLVRQVVRTLGNVQHRSRVLALPQRRQSSIDVRRRLLGRVVGLGVRTVQRNEDLGRLDGVRLRLRGRVGDAVRLHFQLQRIAAGRHGRVGESRPVAGLDRLACRVLQRPAVDDVASDVFKLGRCRDLHACRALNHIGRYRHGFLGARQELVTADVPAVALRTRRALKVVGDERRGLVDGRRACQQVVVVMFGICKLRVHHVAALRSHLVGDVCFERTARDLATAELWIAVVVDDRVNDRAASLPKARLAVRIAGRVIVGNRTVDNGAARDVDARKVVRRALAVSEHGAVPKRTASHHHAVPAVRIDEAVLNDGIGATHVDAMARSAVSSARTTNAVLCRVVVEDAAATYRAARHADAKAIVLPARHPVVADVAVDDESARHINTAAARPVVGCAEVVALEHRVRYSAARQV